LTVLLLVLLAVLLFAVATPRLYASPALAALGQPLGPDVTSADTGLRAPLVGEGPLVRVLSILHDRGVVTGHDPFTGRHLVTLSDDDVRTIGSSQYAIQRYGYSATAKRTISLTFDDGPDPVWTPELLDLLSENHIPATFFTTATMIAKYPEVFQREVREGHAVANHSLTHVDVSATNSARARVEMVLADRVIRAVTSREVAYFRLPYEGNDVESTQTTIDGILRAQRLGYLVTSHDFDTDDWAYAANQRLGTIPLPPLDGRNVTLLLHDGGGEGRGQTVDYVRRLIPYARAHGYTFHTMPQVQPDLAARVITVQPDLWDRVGLRAVQMLFVWPDHLVRSMFLFALFCVVVINTVNAVLAVRRHRRRARVRWPSATEMDLEVSVLLAAYNEERVIARTLHSVLASDFPIREVVVVDDGSADRTAAIVRHLRERDDRVVLVTQPNRGKARALNNGLRHVTGRYVVTLDADTVLTPTTVTCLVRHFALDRTGRLGAVAGVVAVGNRDLNLLTKWQALEYLTQIGIDRAAQDEMDAITIVPGACAAWRTEAILTVGGYTNATLAEDCDLSLCLHAAGWRLTQDDEAMAYTEAPDNVDALLAQRTRWVFGTLQSIWKHRDMVCRARYGPLGWFVLPIYVLSIAVPLVFLPFTTVMAVYAVQQQGMGVVVLYFLLFMLAHLAVAGTAVVLMRARANNLLLVPVYRLVFEPLRAYLLYTSVLMAIRGVRAGWHKLARTGAVDTGVISAIGAPERALIAAHESAS
jgi:biofilm PGA synthesis N-glycosyltransferase PgaC